MQKQIVIQKPAKRPMRVILDEDEDGGIEAAAQVISERRSSELRSSEDQILRPTRTAKVKASQNLVNLTK